MGRAGGQTDGHDEANFCNFANVPNECNVLDCTLNLPEIRVNIERVMLMLTRIIGFFGHYAYKGALFQNRSK